MIKDKVIVLDFDSCIIDTSKSIIQLHNKLNPDKYIEYNPNHDWNFSPMINTKEELTELFKLFDHKDFYGDTLVVFPNAIEVINRLAEDNKVYIVSKHMESRKPLTTKWVNKVMPKVEVAFVDNFEDKGKLFDNAFCIIDDRIDCLNSFNSNVHKICFSNFQWNQDWNYTRCCSWSNIMFSLDIMYYFDYIYPKDIDKIKFEYKGDK